MLTYECPETRKLVKTTIETSQAALKKLLACKISVWCPHCQTGHQIAAADALVVDSLPAAPALPTDWRAQPRPADRVAYK